MEEKILAELKQANESLQRIADALERQEKASSHAVSIEMDGEKIAGFKTKSPY